MDSSVYAERLTLTEAEAKDAVAAAWIAQNAWALHPLDERASYMAEIARDALAPIQIEDSSSFRRLIERVPHGVVLVIAPWNYPYMTAINSVAPALIAAKSFGFVNFTGSVGGGLSVIGYHNLTRPKSFHLKRA